MKARRVKPIVNCVCDNCYKQFKINMHSKQVDNAEVRYFICPHCQKVYVTFAESAKVKAAMQFCSSNKITRETLRKISRQAIDEYLAKEVER